MKAINRLKILFVEKGKTGKWLSEQLGKGPVTVSRWCNNHAQPSVEVPLQIAELRDMNIRDIVNKTKK